MTLFDIKNLYTNIPIKETVEIIKTRLNENKIKVKQINYSSMSVQFAPLLPGLTTTLLPLYNILLYYIYLHLFTYEYIKTIEKKNTTRIMPLLFF